MVLNRIIGLFTVDIGQKFKKNINFVEKEILVKNPQKLPHFQKICLKFDIFNFKKFYLNCFFSVHVVQLDVACEKKKIN